jgi:hypothetical protein
MFPTVIGPWRVAISGPVVVYAGPWFAEPALVAKEPFALDGRGIDGRGSGRVCVLFMRRG